LLRRTSTGGLVPRSSGTSSQLGERRELLLMADMEDDAATAAARTELNTIGAKLLRIKDGGLDADVHEQWIRAETKRLPRLAATHSMMVLGFINSWKQEGSLPSSLRSP